MTTEAGLSPTHAALGAAPLATQGLTALGALAAVLLLAGLAARLARRHGIGRTLGQGRLAVTAATALDPRRRLLLIRCDGREALLLTGPAGDQFLGWLP
ncbi:MAG: flagellar biosynthetic protein FliO [Acetobacteraceae bacterium]|nr:flagellar biosynthetic protein FliO [Acetobacteraceae bacterium]